MVETPARSHQHLLKHELVVVDTYFGTVITVMWNGEVIPIQFRNQNRCLGPEAGWSFSDRLLSRKCLCRKFETDELRQ